MYVRTFIINKQTLDKSILHLNKPSEFTVQVYSHVQYLQLLFHLLTWLELNVEDGLVRSSAICYDPFWNSNFKMSQKYEIGAGLYRKRPLKAFSNCCKVILSVGVAFLVGGTSKLEHEKCF